MEESKRDSIDTLKDQVTYLRSRLNQLRVSRRVLMALLETIDSERRDAIARLEAENRRLKRLHRTGRDHRQIFRSDDRKVLWICRNDAKGGE
ncbi:translation initiation factor 2 [Heliobacterium chlorum]|uniref:Translation initiation factor 2 n=1 Tax=Heliobacterium chlorum TaxID=2698 RepID=A0ABR7T4S5_HELCL|nr:translation initiation factor 2 [Heliobacterium chlorum]MBC9785774.1 translation initiation factor 2 [Heliobacterium chlorum]